MFLVRLCGDSLPPTISLHLERLREALGGCLGSSLTPPWVFNLHPWYFSPFEVDEREDLRIEDVDVKERCN